jgi:hypothetical protein
MLVSLLLAAATGGLGWFLGRRRVHAIELELAASRAELKTSAEVASEREQALELVTFRAGHAHPDEACGTVRDVCPQRRVQHGFQSVLVTQAVDRTDHVRRRVEQGAVEVEQHGRKAAHDAGPGLCSRMR